MSKLTITPTAGYNNEILQLNSDGHSKYAVIHGYNYDEDDQELRIMGSDNGFDYVNASDIFMGSNTFQTIEVGHYRYYGLLIQEGSNTRGRVHILI